MDIESCLERCSRCELLEESEIAALCYRYKETLLDAPNMAQLASPITVVHHHPSLHPPLECCECKVRKAADIDGWSDSQPAAAAH